MMLAALFAVGSTTVSAQDPCEDYDGNAELDAKIRDNYETTRRLKIAIDRCERVFTEVRQLRSLQGLR
jgi:hypothetical protein